MKLPDKTQVLADNCFSKLLKAINHELRLAVGTNTKLEKVDGQAPIKECGQM